MSMADEMLNTLSGDEIEAYAVAEEHIVIGRDRFITVPEALKRIAVQFDHNIETVTFDCPRYWDDNDLTEMTIYINYLCPGEITPGSFVAENVTIDETDSEMIHFTWTITGEVTQKKGTLKFLVCAKSVDDDGLEDLRWNSEINTSMYISEGMDATEQIFERNPDFLTQVLLLADELRNNGAIATIDKTLSMEGSVADAAAVGQALAGKASKTTIPNSATVNEDNELVMQHTEGDDDAELFKVALPAGGSEWEVVQDVTLTEDVAEVSLGNGVYYKDVALVVSPMKINNAAGDGASGSTTSPKIHTGGTYAFIDKMPINSNTIIVITSLLHGGARVNNLYKHSPNAYYNLTNAAASSYFMPTQFTAGVTAVSYAKITMSGEWLLKSGCRVTLYGRK